MWSAISVKAKILSDHATLKARSLGDSAANQAKLAKCKAVREVVLGFTAAFVRCC